MQLTLFEKVNLPDAIRRCTLWALSEDCKVAEGMRGAAAANSFPLDDDFSMLSKALAFILVQLTAFPLLTNLNAAGTCALPYWQEFYCCFLVSVEAGVPFASW